MCNNWSGKCIWIFFFTLELFLNSTWGQPPALSSTCTHSKLSLTYDTQAIYSCTSSSTPYTHIFLGFFTLSRALMFTILFTMSPFQHMPKPSRSILFCSFREWYYTQVIVHSYLLSYPPYKDHTGINLFSLRLFSNFLKL